MMNSVNPPRVVAIIGCGLMGGSLGKALDGKVARRIAVRMPGCDVDPAVVSSGAVDAIEDVEVATREADCFVVATPVGVIPSIIEVIGRSAPAGSLIMDVGSVKQPVVDAMHRVGRSDIDLVAGHPMCGGEFSGIDAARGDLYDGADWVLVPIAEQSFRSMERASSFVRMVGAYPVSMTASQHDWMVAGTSHLVRVVAGALAQTVMGRASRDDTPSSEVPLIGGGMRDATRLARGDVQMWTDIAMANSAHIVAALDMCEDRIAAARACIASHDRSVVESWMQASHSAAMHL